MSDFARHTVVNRNDHLQIGPGQSFAFVSGLGGRSIREQQLEAPWWASVYTSDQNASPGALICTFGEHIADCRFEDIAGEVPDHFTLETSNKPGDGSAL
jgi:hypothetical protein